MSPDVYQVRIEDASRTLGDGFLVGPGFVVTTAAVVRGAGPAVSVRAPGSDAPVAAEVVEVLGSDGLVLLEVAAPGFVVPWCPAPASTTLPGSAVSAGTLHDRLLCFRRFGAARLRADLKFGGGEAGEGESSTAETASEQAGGARRTASNAGESGALLLAYLKERARTGRLDPVVTVPALEGPR